ncbi:MAG: fibronectin type III domain-containing protein, partial [Reichenbachiella sp.]
MKKLSSRLILLTMLLSATAYGQVPTAGLVGEYKFTSGSLSDGISTNDFTQTGTALTNVTDRSGDANNAIDLGGDYLQRNYLHSASLSVSFLMKTTTNNGNKTTIIDQTTRTGDTEDGWGWYIYLQNGRVGVTGKFGAYAPYSSQAGGWSGYSPYTNTLGTSTLSDDEWHHVTVTMTPSTYRPSNGTFVRFYYYYNVYVDNVLESSSTSEITTPGGSYNFYSYAPSSNLLSTTTNVTIANNHNTNLSNKYGDEIDNLRFYNVTLTATDVEGLFTDELCAAPMYVNLSSRTTGSLDIDWSDNGIPTDWDLSYVATGQPANNGTIVSNIGTNSYDITGLSPYTSYDVYVRSHCTAGVTDWSSAATFTTYNVTYVDASATGANNGASWNDAFTDLQDGIALGNTIWVAAGTYTPAASGRTATFSIKNGSRLYGGFNGTETDQSQRNITANATILSGDLSGDDNSTILDTEATRAENSYHVITFRTVQNVIIDGFTIAGGNANGVLSNNCGIAAASQYDHTRGGAIYTNPYIQTQVVSAKFSNCIIEKNTGTSVAVYSSFTPCGVTGLTTDVDFESCIIRDNYSKDLTAMLFIGSSGYQIYSKGSIVNSLMYNNTSNAHSSCLYLGVSTSNGGGAAGLEFEMINTTITKNSGANGNAIYMTNSSNSTIDNSIIYGNGSATPFSIAGSGSVVSNSIIEGGQQSGLDSDPLFTDAANDDFTIGCSSPALDAGNSSVTLPAIDIAGNNRVQTTLDMGAYEYSEPILTAITAIAQDFVVELDADGNAAVTSDDVNNGTGAACGVEFTLSLDKTAFTCADLGDNVVTLTATEDIGGADDQTTATVTIVYPVITQDITVQLDASGDASIIAADIDNGTNTTCTSAHTLSLDKTDFTCADLGDNIVTLSSDDGAGNIRTATATVTVENPITVVTQDISVQLDAITGIATIMADDIDNGSSDSCSGALILSLSKTEFVCADIGANLVTLTIEDVHGNQLTANATVTVSSIVDDETVTVENASICLGGSTTISTGSSVSGNNYYLRNSADDEIVDGPIAGTGSGLDFNTGTLNTATTFNVSADQSVNNQAIKLAGTSGYITIPNSNSLQLNENWTLEAWVKPTGALLHVIETYDGNGGFVLRSNGTHWQAYAMYSSSVASLVTSSTSVVLNEWVHIAATFNETTNELKIYVNGVVDATNSAATIDQRGSLTAIKFGARGDDNQIRNESIQDEMRIWNVERTAQEIADNMSAHLIGNESGLVAYYDVNDLTFEANNMTIPDKSSNANAGTIAGTYTSSNIVDGANIQSNSCPFQMTTEVTVTVEDLTAPTAVIQDITVQLDAAGNATITAADINNGS